MDLTGYTMYLVDLINRYTILIFVKTVLIVLTIFLLWFLPYVGGKLKKRHNKHKTNRKVKLEKEAKRNNLICQIVASVLLVVVGILFIKGDVKTLTALKADERQNSLAIYEGDASLLRSVYYKNANVFYDLIVDSRSVVFEDINEICYIDMSKTDEGWIEEWGEFHGKITYGENSRFILKIE